MSSFSDQNLLFGVLALQMDFVTRDELIAALHAWMADKNTALGRILVVQGKLNEDEHSALDRLVAQHVLRHGGDPGESLSRAAADPKVQQVLREVDGAAESSSLAATTDPGGAAPSSPTPERPAASRYEVLRPHAAGGLGEVFVARDTELNREVALKEIRARYAGEPEYRSRFVLEAEITGGLEHPGVVPVYGLGVYPDGRPFYAMRFIRGETLQAAAESFHAKHATKQLLGESALELRRLLIRFLDVCNAVAYAHSRGVIHRDLKPANVMLGAFGETLVVDWGLAKVVGRNDDSAGEETLRPSSASGSGETAEGQQMGTPSYMSPEQAAGRLEEVNTLSDVYGLGATLYTVLTGKKPVEAATRDIVLLRVQGGKFTPVRAVKPSIPPSLAAVCHRAMALQQPDRYESAQALAADVERWLADEPVSAYRESLPRRAQRWARRHRTVVTSASAALLAVLLLGGAFWWARAAERNRIEVRAGEMMRRVAEYQEAERWADAGTEARSAAELLVLLDATPELDRARAAMADAVLVKRLEEIRLEQASVRGGAFDTKRAGPLMKVAFGEAGLEVMDGDAESVGRAIRDRPVHAVLVQALESWLYLAPLDDRARLAQVLEAADPEPDELSRGIRLAALGKVKAKPDIGMLDRIDVARLTPDRAIRVATALANVDLVPTAVRLLQEVQFHHPGDFWVAEELGYLLDVGAIDFQWESLRAAVAQFATPLPVYAMLTSRLHNDPGQRQRDAVQNKMIVRALRPDSPAVWVNLAATLTHDGRHAEAERALLRALELNPEDGHAYTNLGYVRFDLGDYVGAEQASRKAVALLPENAMGHLNLGNALVKQLRLEEGIPYFRRAIELTPNDFLPHTNLGHTYYLLKRDEEAEKELREAIRLAPSDAKSWHFLGQVLLRRGERDEAESALRRAVDLDATLLSARSELAELLLNRRKFAEAIQRYKELAEQDPENAGVWTNLSFALRITRQFAESEHAARQALRLQPVTPQSWYNLGTALFGQNKLPEADDAFRKAIEYENDPNNLLQLGGEMYMRRRTVPALEAFHKRTRLQPNNPDAWHAVGLAELQQGHFPEAEAAFRKTVEVDPRHAKGWTELGTALYRQQKTAEALQAFAKASELDPADPLPYINRSVLLSKQGRYAESLSLLRRGHELGSKQPNWRQPTKQWIAEQTPLAAGELLLRALPAGR